MLLGTVNIFRIRLRVASYRIKELCTHFVYKVDSYETFLEVLQLSIQLCKREFFF
jgi:hypothetical protein